MNRNIRIEIALGIILLVTVIVGGVIWLQAVVTQPVALVQQTQPVTKQPSVPSELWKTYLNSEFGFQFDYLASSGLDTSKLKVVGGECGGGEKCVELLLPTADGDFMPDWIKNPTPEDVAKYI